MATPAVTSITPLNFLLPLSLPQANPSTQPPLRTQPTSPILPAPSTTTSSLHPSTLAPILLFLQLFTHMPEPSEKGCL
ncbi:hypothetical protein E2C01_097164 [Portunus trituberculatus]|uniref:Uncharacterized protein n=1 Tax=Portunus trituberculatus TaxID=210409 RepID=A0A5B7K8V3_PORTR|nr:hypothetical protein [Portunus trituberculatus]